MQLAGYPASSSLFWAFVSKTWWHVRCSSFNFSLQHSLVAWKQPSYVNSCSAHYSLQTPLLNPCYIHIGIQFVKFEQTSSFQVGLESPMIKITKMEMFNVRVLMRPRRSLVMIALYLGPNTSHDVAQVMIHFQVASQRNGVLTAMTRVRRFIEYLHLHLSIYIYIFQNIAQAFRSVQIVCLTHTGHCPSLLRILRQDQLNLHECNTQNSAPMAGMRPLGLIFKNQSSFCSLFLSDIVFTVCGNFISFSATEIFQPFGVPARCQALSSTASIILNKRSFGMKA
jgi:hypothetical protein